MHLTFLTVADTLTKSVEPAVQTLSDMSLLLLLFSHGDLCRQTIREVR